MGCRNTAVHSRARAALLPAAQLVRRRKRKTKLRPRRKATAECAPARDWEKLLPDLMSLILGCLPPRDVCRARAVCRHWNELVSSPVFLRQHSERAGNACLDAPTVAHLDYGNRSPVVAFHAELKRWVRLPAFFSHSNETYLVAATKGLYVYNVTRHDDTEDTWSGGDDSVRLHKRSQLVVTNPWTGATKWLPLMLNERGPFYSFVPGEVCVFALDVVDNGQAYIITGINPRKFRGEVYDSRLGYWSAFSAPLDSAFVNMPSGFNWRRVRVRWRCARLMGCLYFAAGDGSQSVSANRYIISFDLANRKWALVYDLLVTAPERFADDMRANLGHREFEPWRISTCGNKLVVVEMWTTITGFGGQILTLDVERQVLSHETLIPRTLARRLAACADPGSDFLNAAIGHVLYFFPCPDNKLTTYDFHTKIWKTWASSPLDYKQMSEDSAWVDNESVLFGPRQVVDVQLSLLPVV